MGYLSVREFADTEGVSPSTVRRWITLGLPSEPGPNGVLMIEEEEGQAWLVDQDEVDEEDEDEPDDDC